MNNLVRFNNHNIELIQHNGQAFISGAQIGRVIELAQQDGAAKIYNRHREEFTDEMTTTVRRGKTTIRIFNREGAWLIGMFARTPKAAEFRRWVLKVLGTVSDSERLKQVQHDTIVREHKRALPSGKKEIVLSEKAKQEIGGIAKAVVTKTLDEKLPQYLRPSDKLSDKVISAAFHQTADEMQEKKKVELKEYHLSRSEAEVIEIIRSANTFNMLNLYMGVSNKLSV